MTAYVLKRVKDYYKYEYQDWTQPIMTANGTMGGDTFAASQTGFSDAGLEAYRAFDNNTSTVCYFAKSTGYFQWYNPNPLKTTNLKLTNYIGDSWGTRALTSGSIQVSNDGSDFVELKAFTNSATGGGENWNIDLSSNTGYYKYYRIVCTGNSYTNAGAVNQCHIAEIKITATEQITVKGSVTDYDFRTSKAYVLKRKKYWKKVSTEVTKYWKEIVTESTELAYACYRLDAGYFLIYYYAKLPLGSDLTGYISINGVGSTANSSSELTTNGNVFTSISENSAVLISQTYTRYTAGDLYETVQTTEVVEGTPDDYTYTETEVIESAVTGTPEDYDFMVDKSYVLKRKQYWKYEYQDWEQPVLNADGTIGGDSFAVKLSSVQGSHLAFHAFDNKTDTFARTGAPQPQWFMMYNPNPLNISKIEYIFGTNNLWATSLDIQASVDGVDNSWVTLLSLSELKPQDYTWDIDTGGKSYKYYRLYIKSANRTDPTQGGYYAQFSELKLTAQEQYTVPATKDDYDFITD